MKATITTRVSIGANQDLVFKYLTDLRYHYLWNPQIRSISSRGKLKLGSSYDTESIILGINIHATNRVVVFEPPNEIQIENITGTVQYQANFRLKSYESAFTLVICTTTVSTDNKAFVFTAPIMKQLARRELQTDLQALKLAIENRLE